MKKDKLYMLYLFKIKTYEFKTKFFYKLFFNHIGYKTKILKPIKIVGANKIFLGDNVFIGERTHLQAVISDHEKDKIILIGNNVSIGHFSHIIGLDEVYIGDNVLIADKVYISDNYHVYENINEPIYKQGVKSKGKVSIGSNSWIGENVSIISCKIGKNCVIGANSVVVSDIPDYSIAVGAPAKVVKRYDLKTRKWLKVDER